MYTGLRNTLNIHDTVVIAMFGVGLFMLWLLLAGYTIKDLSAKVMLTLTGHLRTPPDPWLESALRNAFAEFDRELAAILHEQGYQAAPRIPRSDASLAVRSACGNTPTTARRVSLNMGQPPGHRRSIRFTEQLPAQTHQDSRDESGLEGTAHEADRYRVRALGRDPRRLHGRDRP